MVLSPLLFMYSLLVAIGFSHRCISKAKNASLTLFSLKEEKEQLEKDIEETVQMVSLK